MAFKEVELTPEEIAAASASFFKFNAIGDRFLGLVLKVAEVDGKFGKETHYTCKVKSPEGVVSETILRAPTDADMKLKKAKTAPGNKIMITYASDRDVGKASPMKVFKVLVDSDPTPTKPPPPPVPVAADDIDF